jgi:hypothetical protein
MDINDSGSIRNGIKLRSILLATVIHLTLAIFTLGLWLLVVLAMFAVTHFIIEGEIESVRRDSTKFKKSFPFRYFGLPFGDFIHVFYFDGSLKDSIVSAVARELGEKTPASSLKEIIITDVDNDLRHHEERSFFIADAGHTMRGTAIALLLRVSDFGKMQAVRWWVTAGGYVDRDKRFNFQAYSPFLFWFWIIPYLSRDYDVLSPIRTIYSSAYNDFDVITQIRSLHEAVFTALVDELDSHGIDTSDIRVQRMQVMNISISGGRVSMGNVVQGAMNKIAAKMPAAA